MKSFKLLSEKRFGPFFWTQFWGAFNDNLYKNALILLIAFRATSESESGLWINLASGLFILPFLLFSPLAGQICDKYEKSKAVRIIKIAEIIIMALGALAFAWGNNVALISILFLMGAQSAFFGPTKYSLLPQTLKSDELVAGNAMIELGTFLAILLGTVAGGVVIGHYPETIGFFVVAIAVIGYLTSRNIPIAKSFAPDLKIRLSFWPEVVSLAKIAREERSVHLSILGISWFWFYGAVFLSQIPNFVKFFIGGNESVGTLFLAVFSVSIGLGSLICERLSRDDIELGLVPVGAFGMSLFAFDLGWIQYNTPSVAIGFFDYIFSSAGSWRVIFDLSMIGVFGSLYIVPLYALIQKRSSVEKRSRIIAWNNIVNSVLIVLSAVFGILLYKLGFTTVQIFTATAILNLAVATYIFFLIPEFMFRFLLWILAVTVYRIEFEGRENVPPEGPLVIVSNHVTFIDWLIITAACRRPARFVMDHRFFFIPVVKWFFNLVHAIPIAPSKESEAVKEKAFGLISKELRDGQVVCVYPEGQITRNGQINPFRPGIERILAQDPVPVVPVGLDGLWGSFFSRFHGRALKGNPLPKRRRITIRIGAPMPPTSSASELELEVRRLATPKSQS